ncbi:hypothetical protein C6P61_05790 [Malikia spinosa]|uniref:PAS domain S-box protein n=2 Tax=Malikia spinosa TaxID=86180 RepID=A0A2S9KG42_9BURK|nr:hypothetical protein C6P61_05790 [Malikia spinosa]
MSLNTSTIQGEFDYDQRLTLMSVTDTQSHISYANAAFVEVSGYDYEELQGQPHKVVRHPDMPAEAFADMWSTMKAGMSWTALVKNRRKNGDHYWVRANAAPMVRAGRIAGYISVRTKPLREEVAAAEQLYGDFRAARAGSRRFYRGLIVRTGIWSWLSWFQLISVAARMRLVLALLALGNLGLLASLGLGAVQLAIAAAVTLLLTGLGDCLLQAQISRPLTKLAQQAQSVAAGNPGRPQHLNRVDDIGMIMRSVNQAGLNLRALVDDVHVQVDGIQGVGEQIKQAGNDLSVRTEQSASGLEQTSASMEELTSTVMQNADGACQATQLAQEASQAAVRGGEVVGQVVDVMQRITSSSQRIADIIGLIDGIAFQTNILALNAAVEAARAGEQGRGFAVVASEVRSLAQRSAAAAQEIKSLIGQSVAEVRGGSALVQQAGETMGVIVREVQRVSQLISEITTSSSEQANGIAQVSVAVVELDRATQENAVMVQGSVNASHELMARAERLDSAVAVYRNMQD